MAGAGKGADAWFVFICFAMLLVSMAALSEFTMDVQGSIFCLSSGNKATPINGATAKIICKRASNRGETSITSGPRNSRGFYTASTTTMLKLGKCRAFLHSSALHGCSSPTDVNGGKSGAPLIPFSSSSSNHNDSHYSVKTLFYSP
ncbi:hypothetical protein V2J09_004107 [Rumex salicifolius]